MIKLVCSKYSAVLLFCLLALVARAEDGTSFVSVKDGKFYLQGKEYRYVGTNLWYGAILGSEGQGGNRKRLVQELKVLHTHIALQSQSLDRENL
jgi:mannan endo-1,4-beta-mannosidase